MVVFKIRMPRKEPGPPKQSYYDIALKRMQSTEKPLKSKKCMEVVAEEVRKLVDQELVSKFQHKKWITWNQNGIFRYRQFLPLRRAQKCDLYLIYLLKGTTAFGSTITSRRDLINSMTSRTSWLHGDGTMLLIQATWERCSIKSLCTQMIRSFTNFSEETSLLTNRLFTNGYVWASVTSRHQILLQGRSKS